MTIRVYNRRIDFIFRIIMSIFVNAVLPIAMRVYSKLTGCFSITRVDVTTLCCAQSLLGPNYSNIDCRIHLVGTRCLSVPYFEGRITRYFSNISLIDLNGIVSSWISVFCTMVLAKTRVSKNSTTVLILLSISELTLSSFCIEKDSMYEQRHKT